MNSSSSQPSCINSANPSSPPPNHASIKSPNSPPPETLRVEYWAQVIEHRALDHFNQVRALNGQHIWREEILADRFQWGRELSIYAILVRVHRLPMKLELPMLPDYAGCKSWVTLAHSAPFTSDPVCSDESFRGQLKKFSSDLQGISS